MWFPRGPPAREGKRIAAAGCPRRSVSRQPARRLVQGLHRARGFPQGQREEERAAGRPHAAPECSRPSCAARPRPIMAAALPGHPGSEGAKVERACHGLYGGARQSVECLLPVQLHGDAGRSAAMPACGWRSMHRPSFTRSADCKGARLQ
jgi:hypothetical protein